MLYLQPKCSKNSPCKFAAGDTRSIIQYGLYMSMPNGMKLEQAYEAQRTLLTTRKTERRGGVMNESFTYNERSELTGAQRGSDRFAYAYDNIGNRKSAEEEAESITYRANELNQYTQINTNGSDFRPEYDAEGNQTLIKTATGIWHVTYNAQNRAVKFESADGSTLITCAYDYAGRRFEKKVVTNGTITTHQRFIYRNYLQIAAVNLKADASTPDLWFLIWDPTQPVTTRPLAIRKDGTWYTYGWDLTKNVCELYGQQGYIRTIYRYSPYGTVTAEGDVTQPIQWSSEVYDSELSLNYYNYRYYNPADGRWTRRDPLGAVEGVVNLYGCGNAPLSYTDILGMVLSAKEYIEKFKDFPHCGKSYCEIIGEFFDHLAHDSECNSLQDFANLLEGGEADSLANEVAVGLAKILNAKSSISTKLFNSPDKDKYMKMHERTPDNLKKVGFSPDVVANGNNNIRHLTFILKYGKPGYVAVYLSDLFQRMIPWSKPSRIEETDAEIIADKKARSIYRKLSKYEKENGWNMTRELIRKLWLSEFCQ